MLFTKYRTFFIMFGVLVFFLMIFAHAYETEGFSDYSTKDNIYEKGGSVYINGEFNNTTDIYGRYNTRGPLSKTTTSSASCELACDRQDECNPINKNVCSSSYNAYSKTCSCSFSRNKLI